MLNIFRQSVLYMLITPLSLSAGDWRDIRNGSELPDEGYCDQPYVVVNDDGSWTCVLTTGKGQEGSLGQHVVSTISRDRGKTWSALVDIEPATGPEASWVVPLKTDFGRIYAFYTFNGDNVRPGRSDTHGWYAFRYSDDGGRSWSKQRYRIPMRETAADRTNGLPKGCPHFWGIDKPKVIDGTVYFAFTKLGKYFLGNGEGWVVKSENVMSEKDPAKIKWRILPDGDHGLRHPDYGSVQEEHNLVPISKERFYCVYRTTKGFPAVTLSQDAGITWTKPTQMRYSPAGRIVRTPRACPKLWKCRNGKYLFWYHNHAGKTFRGRNPVWLMGGVAEGDTIHWSEPDILLYHNDPKGRGMSYPDLIEDDGRYYVTETQKTIARVHEIPASFLEALWGQASCKSVAKSGILMDVAGAAVQGKRLPALPDLSKGKGFSIEFQLQLSKLDAGQVIFDNRNNAGAGLTIQTVAKGALELAFGDGKHTSKWQSDPGLLQVNTSHHVVFTIDGGPKIITVLIDGKLCDGAGQRQFGWGRFDAKLGGIASNARIKAIDSGNGAITSLRVYGRYITTSEAVGNYNATK